MSSTDRTFTTRYNILRGRIINNFHLQNPMRYLEGPNTPASIVTIMNNSKASGSCCPVSSPTCIPNVTNLVQNGDFATGDFSEWIPSGNPNNTIVNTSPPLPSPAGALYGYEAGNSVSNVTLTQNIPTTVGQTYTLSYYLFDEGYLGSDADTIYFSASVSATPIAGSIISYTSPPPNPGFDWTLYSFVFTATSNSTPLIFTTRNDNSYFYLTNISVTATCS